MRGISLDSRSGLIIGVVIVLSIMAYRVAIGMRSPPPGLPKATPATISADAPIKSSPPAQAAPMAKRDDVGGGVARQLSPDGLTRLDSSRIDEAVRRGCDWLLGRLTGIRPDDAGLVADRDGLHGLMLYALMLGGRLGPGDGELTAHIQALRSVPPVTVRAAATRVMVLTRHGLSADSVHVMEDWKDLIRCIQYLVDNQGPEGSWGLGAPIDVTGLPCSWSPPRSSRRVRYALRRRSWGADGDATGTGWAVAGLDACSVALEGRGSIRSVYPPNDCVSRLEAWLTDGQNPDGGWGERRGEASTGSAMAAGLAGLSWCIRMWCRSPDKDVRIQKAYAWIRGNVAPGEDGTEGGMTADQRVYCLRRAADSMRNLRGDPGDVVERAVRHILDRQDADGGWGSGADRDWETCRAIIALRMP